MVIDSKSVLAASAIVGAATCIYMAYLYMKKSQKLYLWKPVATVAKLYVHPIKSCKGILVDEITSLKPGVMLPGSQIGDRTLMVVCGVERRFATIRQFPKMALVEPTAIGNDTLQLNAPGMAEIKFVVPKYDPQNEVLMYKVFGEECPGVDCGDEVAEWFAEYLEVKIARLVYHHQELPSNKRKKLLGFGHLGVYSREPVSSVFQDFSPFNMLSEASMDALNERLETKLTERSFRPNVLLTGCNSFEEDTWKHIRVGSNPSAPEFVFAEHCTRCLLTTVDPETGVKSENTEPLATLKKFRQCKEVERPLYKSSPKFAVNFANIKEGNIQVGDIIYSKVIVE